MKKQLIIAAVAATMSVSALADISITGAASATYTSTDFDSSATASTNEYSTDTDLTITGTSGDTVVTVSLDLEDSDNVDVGEIKMTTTIAGVDLTITDDTCTSAVGNGCTGDENVELIAATTIAGVTLTFEDSNSSANGSLSAAVDVAGLTVTIKQAESSTSTTVSGDMGGITGKFVNFAHDTVNKDYSTVEVSGSVLASTITITNHSGETATAAFLDLDGSTGDESSDATIIALTTDLGGNSITVTSTDGNHQGTAKADKLVVAGTRALASGADLTATYTKDDLNNKSSIALKIAVSF